MIVTLLAVAAFSAGAELSPLKPPFDSLMKIIVDHADPEDARLAEKALLQGRPRLVVDEWHGEPYGRLIAVSTASWGLGVAPGYVEAKTTSGRLPFNADRVAAMFAQRGLAGAPVPLAAVSPEDDHRKAEAGPDEPRRFVYSDGSVRVELSTAQMAGVFLHELAHLKRRLDGGGAEALIDERDAQSAQCRLWTRLQQAGGGHISLDGPARQFLKRCQKTPELIEGDLLQGLLDEPLTPSVGEAVAARRAEVDRRLGRDAAAFHMRWRARMERQFLAAWRRWLREQRAGGAQRVDELEKRDAAALADPWNEIPHFELPREPERLASPARVARPVHPRAKSGGQKPMPGWTEVGEVQE